MNKIIKKFIASRGYKIEKHRFVDDTDLYIREFGKDAVLNRRFYNICGGGHYDFGMRFNHSCWTNIDLDRPCLNGNNFDPNRDISHDLLSLKPLPLESNSAEHIYSQYTIEHITDEAATVFLREAYRSLRKGGSIRLVCPNNRLDYLAYTKQDLSFFSWVDMFSKPGYYQEMMYNKPLNQASLEQIFIVHFASNASTIHADGADERIDDDTIKAIIKEKKFEDAMNFFVSKCSVDKQKLYRQNHINWWTHEKIFQFLNSAGFKQVYTMSPGQSSTPIFRNKQHFDRHWPFVALYIEAIKN